MFTPPHQKPFLCHGATPDAKKCGSPHNDSSVPAPVSDAYNLMQKCIGKRFLFAIHLSLTLCPFPFSQLSGMVLRCLALRPVPRNAKKHLSPTSHMETSIYASHSKVSDRKRALRDCEKWWRTKLKNVYPHAGTITTGHQLTIHVTGTSNTYFQETRNNVDWDAEQVPS